MMENNSISILRAALTKWRFAFVLSLAILTFQYSVIFGINILTPANHSWLGATITNPSDTGVYINYLNQAKSSLFLQNYFSNPAHISRFDLFWSLGGQLGKLGLSPIQNHELLRIIATIVLGFAIFASARSVTKTEQDAQIGSWLMISGVSMGWLYSVFMSVSNLWQFGSLVPADLSNEFAVAPILLGGAHMILSFAFLLLGTRWIWQAINQNEQIKTYQWLIIAFHVGFHPYYIPIYGLISIFALIKVKLSHLKQFLIFNLALLPGAVYGVYLIMIDSKFREHHLIINNLPLDPVWMWLIILFPFIIAFIWMLHKKYTLTTPRNSWIYAWIFAAMICIILPFPWNRKFTQALLPALVMLTLPFWLSIFHSLKPKVDLILKLSLILLLLFPFLHLTQSQIALGSDPAWYQYFYVKNETKNAWNLLNDPPTNGLIACTNLYNCLWTPAFTQKHVWIGHNHETPDFINRFYMQQAWRKTNDSQFFNDFLEQNNITHVIADKNDYIELFSSAWQMDFHEGNISVWSKKN
jgi:hypothetical protein